MKISWGWLACFKIEKDFRDSASFIIRIIFKVEPNELQSFAQKMILLLNHVTSQNKIPEKSQYRQTESSFRQTFKTYSYSNTFLSFLVSNPILRSN